MFYPRQYRKPAGFVCPVTKAQILKIFLERAEDIAVRTGVMKDTDRVGHYSIGGRSEPGYEPDEQKPGRSVQEILKNRKNEDDYILIGHLCGLLMEKENAQGFDSFSNAEISVYLVGDMIRQLDSGGFGTYFYNTGHLARLILQSLDEIGADELGELVKEAISIYGKIPSSDYDEMLEELSDITGNFENDPWEDLDRKYYELDENLGKKIMDYTDINQEHFSL